MKYLHRVVWTFSLAAMLAAGVVAIAQEAPVIKPETPAQAKNAASPPSPVIVPLAVGTAFNARLLTPLDARHNKAGDVFTAEMLETVRYQGSVILGKGTTIYGHVVRCSTAGHGRRGSGLFLQFDRAVLKSGGEAMLNAGLQAVAPGPNQPATNEDADSEDDLGVDANDRIDEQDNRLAAPLDSADSPRHVIGAVATIPQTTYQAPPIELPVTQGSFTKHGLITHDSEGALGMPSVKLYTPLSAGSSGSVLLSSQKSLRLDAGTKLLIVIQPATAAPDSQ